MTLILCSPDGRTFQTEAAHGIFKKHWREYQKSDETSTDPIASIFAWARGLVKRGEIDGTEEVVRFAQNLEKACLETVDINGIVTKDLAFSCGKTDRASWVTIREFMDWVEQRLKGILAAQ